MPRVAASTLPGVAELEPAEEKAIRKIADEARRKVEQRNTIIREVHGRRPRLARAIGRAAGLTHKAILDIVNREMKGGE